MDNEEYDRFEEWMAEQEGLTKKNPAAIPTEQPVDLFVVIPDNDVLQTKESP